MLKRLLVPLVLLFGQAVPSLASYNPANPVDFVYAGNPNGNLACTTGTVGGAPPNSVWDTAHLAKWICTTTGTSMTAVWQIQGSMTPVTVASASTVDLGAQASTSVTISGTTTVTSFGSTAVAGQIYTLTFSGAMVLTYNATSLILPTAANITTAAGDTAIAEALGSGNWKIISYQLSSGLALVSPNPQITQIRQTVLSGDSTSGVASFMTTGSGLTPAFTATAPLVITFSSGFGASGAVDYVTKLNAGASTAACTASNTNYVYATYVSATSVTWGCTTLQPVYQISAPGSPSTGQYWFNTSSYVMQSWNGSSWVTSNTVFVGEAVAGSSTITSVVSYAFQGRAFVSQASLAVSTTYTLSHNIGTNNVTVDPYYENVTSDAGFTTGMRTVIVQDDNANTLSGGSTVWDRLNTYLRLSGSSPWVINGSNSGSQITLANWKWGAVVRRAF